MENNFTTFDMFSRSLPKFSGISRLFFSFFLVLFLAGLFSGNVFAVTDDATATTTSSPVNTSTQTVAQKIAAEKKEGNISSMKDCIKANTGGNKNPVDVCYRQAGTGRTADLTEWGQFSEQQSVGGLFQKILRFFMAIVGGLALLAIMIGGGMIMLGGTDETMLERGKDILKYTAMGVAIVLLAVTITTLVQTFFYSVDV